MKIILSIFIILLSFNLFAVDLEIKHERTIDQNVEFIWIQDESFPVYTVSIYFGDGAISDDKQYLGETQAMFDLIDSGTTRYTQKQIADNLEFYGVSYGANVTHEYSVFSVSGLTKDAVPTLKKICHLFRESTYPKKEVSKYKKLGIDGLKNLVNNHGALASHAFRVLSMKNTAVGAPSAGTMKSIRRFSSDRLQNKLKYFNNEVKKRIYLSGPKSIYEMRKIFINECEWAKKSANYVRSIPIKKPESKGKVYLVTVPKANQAQIRIGRYLGESEIQDKDELFSLITSYLGSGFTSRLMQELRVKRGLTYGAYSFVGGQKGYGRAGITTSTKNVSVKEAISVIKNIVGYTTSGEFPQELIQNAKGNLSGSYLFDFEQKSDLLKKLMYYDHVGLPYSRIYQYRDRLMKLSKSDVMREVKNIYNWENQDIIIVGPSALKKDLKEFGKVEVIPYKKVL